jgi:hypothetical protein
MVIKSRHTFATQKNISRDWSHCGVTLFPTPTLKLRSLIGKHRGL